MEYDDTTFVHACIHKDVCMREYAYSKGNCLFLLLLLVLLLKFNYDSLSLSSFLSFLSPSVQYHYALTSCTLSTGCSLFITLLHLGECVILRKYKQRILLLFLLYWFCFWYQHLKHVVLLSWKKSVVFVLFGNS